MSSTTYYAQAQTQQISTPDWGMLGVLLAFVSLVVAIIIGIAQIRAARRPRKDINCHLITSVPLLRVDDRFKSHLQVTYQGQEIKDASSIVLRVSNSGQLPITPTDFVRPIAFIFKENTEILNAEVLKAEPQNLGAMLSVTKNIIEVQPLLMNSGDYIDISTVVASFEGDLTVDGRVVDVKIIRLEEESEKGESKIRENLTKMVVALMFSFLAGGLPLFIDFYSNVLDLIQKLQGY